MLVQAPCEPIVNQISETAKPSVRQVGKLALWLLETKEWVSFIVVVIAAQVQYGLSLTDVVGNGFFLTGTCAADSDSSFR